MKYNDLQTQSTQNRKRVGRGIAAGQGKTAGRGTKGQGARTGGCNRRRHGDGLVAPGEQASHCGHAAHLDAAIGDEPGRLEKQMEAPEGGNAGLIAERRN